MQGRHAGCGTPDSQRAEFQQSGRAKLLLSRIGRLGVICETVVRITRIGGARLGGSLALPLRPTRWIHQTFSIRLAQLKQGLRFDNAEIVGEGVESVDDQMVGGGFGFHETQRRWR